MLQSAVYLTGTRTIEIELTRLVLPHLFDLKENFTSYALAAAFRLTSKFAKRIYQVCSQWKDRGETKKYSIEELKVLDADGGKMLADMVASLTRGGQANDQDLVKESAAL